MATFLAQTAVFKGVPTEVLTKLAPHVDQQVVAAGRPLIGPGAIVTTLGFLHTGKASMQVVDAFSGNKTTLEEIFPGDFFGEVGMVLGAASPIVVMAEDECETLAIQKAHFDKIAAAIPDTLQALAKRMGTRFVKVSLLGGKKAGAGKSGPPDPIASVAPNAAAPGPAGPSFSPPGAALPKGAIPFVEVANYAVGPKVLELIPSRVILEHRILPLELRGRTLLVGMVSPFSLQAKEDLRRALHSVDPEIVAISADDFGNAILRLKVDVRDQRPAGAGAVSRAIRPQYSAEVKKEADKQLQVMIGDEIVQLLDRILTEAVDRGVSDVHIEPESTGVRIRYRLQGMLVERKEMVPASYAAPLAARIKVLAELDITDRRLPQDGRIVAMFGSREMNFRISTMPAARGEKVVIRVLDPGDVMRPLEHIFADPRALELVQRANGAAHGAIVVAGTTGSGKSSTLYSLLNSRKLTRPDNNIVTVEDPIEFLVPGLSQSGLSPKAGLEYPLALRALMRQDPDVIMVGELRDSATAGMVLEAALTGHLVLSTMHGSRVQAVFQRLEHFGCDMLRIGQAMNVILVQKLVRKLCIACVREEDVAPQLVEALVGRKLLARGGPAKLPRAIGCEACNMSGYRGRVASQEVLFFDDEVRLALETGASISDILARAEKNGHFISFAANARLLMHKRAMTPADAIALTD
ncbi:MAG TPA: ATPase, T2SS/T4P/T4SS family [Polyangiaceae bacterium]